MPTRETDQKEGNTEPFPVDISKIEISDSIQSHLSTMTSSKRTRMHPGLSVPELASIPDLAHPYSQSDGYDHTRGTWSFLPGNSAHIPLSTRASRQERSWSLSMAYCVFVLYCLLSCLMAIVHLYTNIFNPAMHRITAMPLGTHENMPARSGVAQYLTRSLVASALLEPFVLASAPTIESNVTICAWLSDSELHVLSRWMKSWQGSVSLLVTTTTATSSPSHRKLLEMIRPLNNRASMAGVSIHLLHVGDHNAGSPNLYLNLARLFASTEWILIIPGILEDPVPHKLQNIIFSTISKTGAGEYILAFGNQSYPFPELSPLLIRRDRDFWCTERIAGGKSRGPDWNECLWQLNLETLGAIRGLNVPMATPALKVDDKISVVEGVVRQRVTARHHAETCDSVIKQMSTVRARSRHRSLELDWVKGFCSKSMDRKQGF